MSFSKVYLTQKGIALCAKLIGGQDLEILSVQGGDGPEIDPDYSQQMALSHPCIQFEMHKGVVYDPEYPKRVTLPIYYSNEELNSGIALSEIGVLANDPDEGEILFCVLPAYDMPLALPGIDEGRLELTMDLMLELSLSPEVSILLPPSVIYLTKPEADVLYATKKHRHPAEEIDESNGYTTEAWQRHQDAQIEALQLKTDAGTTTAETIQRGTVPESNWTVLKHWGIYDREKGVFYA